MGIGISLPAGSLGYSIAAPPKASGTSGFGPTLPSPAPGRHGSYRGISCRLRRRSFTAESDPGGDVLLFRASMHQWGPANIEVKLDDEGNYTLDACGSLLNLIYRNISLR